MNSSARSTASKVRSQPPACGAAPTSAPTPSSVSRETLRRSSGDSTCFQAARRFTLNVYLLDHRPRQSDSHRTQSFGLPRLASSLSRVPGKASRPRDSAEPTTSQHARRTSHLRQTFATTREAPTRSISSRRRSPASGLRPRHTWALLRAQSPWHHESQFCRRVAFGRPSISPVAATRTWEVTIQVSGARRGPDGRPDGRPNGRAFGRGAPQSPVRGLWTGNRFT